MPNHKISRVTCDANADSNPVGSKLLTPQLPQMGRVTSGLIFMLEMMFN
jgi:hypothetical protein